MWPGHKFLSAKDGQAQYLSDDTKFMSKKTKIWEVIPVLVIFGCVFNPLLRGCGRSQKFFTAKDGQSQYLFDNTKFMSKKIWQVIAVLVIFGRVFNPPLRGCGRGQKNFLGKR